MTIQWQSANCPWNNDKQHECSMTNISSPPSFKAICDITWCKMVWHSKSRRTWTTLDWWRNVCLELTIINMPTCEHGMFSCSGVRGLNDPLQYFNHACKVVMASSLFCRTSKSSSGHGPDADSAERAMLLPRLPILLRASVAANRIFASGWSSNWLTSLAISSVSMSSAGKEFTITRASWLSEKEGSFMHRSSMAMKPSMAVWSINSSRAAKRSVHRILCELHSQRANLGIQRLAAQGFQKGTLHKAILFDFQKLQEFRCHLFHFCFRSCGFYGMDGQAAGWNANPLVDNLQERFDNVCVNRFPDLHQYLFAAKSFQIRSFKWQKKKNCM